MSLRLKVRLIGLVLGMVGYFVYSTYFKGYSSYGEMLDHYRAEMQPLVDEYKGIDPTQLKPGPVSLAKGRKVLFIEDNRADLFSEYREGKDRLLPEIATKPGEVGIVILKSVKRETTASWTYQNGKKGYGAWYTLVAIAVPEKQVIGRWKSYAGPPTTSYQIKGVEPRDEHGYYTTDHAMKNLAALHAGQLPELGEPGDAVTAAK